MIEYFRIFREPETPVVFDPSIAPPKSVEELHFSVRVHQRWYPRGRFQASHSNDRIYFEPVPLQPCSWEEVLCACEVLAELRGRAQEIRDRDDLKRAEREQAVRALGRFLRWVGVPGGATATDLRSLANERERRWALEALGRFLQGLRGAA
jgi:hypothetical protein